MKNLKIKSIFILALLTIAFAGCKNAIEEKKENLKEADENVTEAKGELNEARLDSAKQYAKYKSEMDHKLMANDTLIATMKEQINTDKKIIRDRSDKELAILKAKNEALKLKIIAHKDETYDSWMAFKLSFNQDMDDLGKSISEMAHKNMKKN